MLCFVQTAEGQLLDLGSGLDISSGLGSAEQPTDDGSSKGA